MADDGHSEAPRGQIRFWLSEASITLLAAFIGAQAIRHGTLLVRPTGADAAYTLVAFAVIFALVVVVTFSSDRLNNQDETEDRPAGNES